MAKEDVNPEEIEEKERSQEELDALQEASFAEGLNVARNLPPEDKLVDGAGRKAKTSEDLDEEPEKQEAEPAKPVKESKEKEEQEEPLIAGLKESELKAILAKVNDLDLLKGRFDQETQKIYGKLGEINKRTLDLGNRTSTPATVQITPEMFKSIAKEFPDFAKMLAEDLSQIPLGGQSAPSVTPDMIEKVRTELVNEYAEKDARRDWAFNEKLLTLKHPDWRQARQSADYELWYATLPPTRQNEVYSTSDGLVAAAALDEFKDWKTKRQTQLQKNKRLEDAVVPQGTPQNQPKETLDADAMFEKGKKQALRQRGFLR